MTGSSTGTTVSVVIPAYNQARFLRSAVESVLAQTQPADDVVVVDDGSTDETRDVLDYYGNRIAVIHQSNLGVSSARNRGFRATTGSLVAFLDADDAWMPTKLAQQVALFDSDPGLGLVHVGVTFIDGEGNSLGQTSAGLDGWVFEELVRFRRPVILGGGSGFVVRRALVDRVGGFDEELSTSADWDLFVRIAGQARVGFIPDPLLQYRLHGSNMHTQIPLMEHDMLKALDKTFASLPRDERARLRRTCYGRVWLVLAASYLKDARYPSAFRSLVHSLALDPRHAGMAVAARAVRCRSREATHVTSLIGH